VVQVLVTVHLPAIVVQQVVQAEVLLKMDLQVQEIHLFSLLLKEMMVVELPVQTHLAEAVVELVVKVVMVLLQLQDPQMLSVEQVEQERQVQLTQRQLQEQVVVEVVLVEIFQEQALDQLDQLVLVVEQEV
tara:strand:- start:146 stop:538 length:393 start_codon:yes stop_codon:yes gene_type:complete